MRKEFEDARIMGRLANYEVDVGMKEHVCLIVIYAKSGRSKDAKQMTEALMSQ